MKSDNKNQTQRNDEVSGLAFLPIRQRELLRILAEQDGRTEIRELLWLIEARAAGKLKDIGDEKATPIVPQELQPLSLGRTQGIAFERGRGQSDSQGHPHLPPTSPLPSTDR